MVGGGRKVASGGQSPSFGDASVHFYIQPYNAEPPKWKEKSEAKIRIKSSFFFRKSRNESVLTRWAICFGIDRKKAMGILELNVKFRKTATGHFGFSYFLIEWSIGLALKQALFKNDSLQSHAKDINQYLISGVS